MRLFFLLLFSFACLKSFAQVGDSAVTLLEYLTQHEVSEVVLRTDMKNLRKNKFKEKVQPAEFSFSVNDTLEVKFDLEIRSRGNMRKRVCNYAPIKLNFPKSALRAHGLKTADKYKLVCQCNDSKTAQQWLFKEYLAYKLNNIVTDNSFKAHLFTVDYVCPNSNKTKTRYAFLLESDKELAERLNGVMLERDSINIDQVKRSNVVEMGMFQYMIGNTDFNLVHKHNLKGVQVHDKDQTILIAYDFDFSGLVDTRYAVPNPELPVRDVKQRWFNIRGCRVKDVQEQIDHYLARKDEILNYCQNFTILSGSFHNAVNNYISEFFEIIEKPDIIKKEFIHK